MKSFWNPFTTYCAACAIVVPVYSLGFSSLYPDLTWSVIVFLLFAVISAGLLSFFVKDIAIPRTPVADANTWEWFLAGSFVIGYAAEFAFSGGIPLLQALSGASSDYSNFGIPTFHVFLVGISSFFSVYWWDCYLTSKRKRYLTIAFIGLVAPLLMFSRGGVLINAIAFAFAYGNRRGLRRKAMLLGVLLVAVVLGFGYLGEIRAGERAANVILSIGGANERFLNSRLPDSTFWFYLYVSSPLANLQYAELHRAPDNIKLAGIAIDFLPDFVSRHLAVPDDVGSIDQSMLIANLLTVGTAYARPLINLGWIGPYALHILFLGFSYGAMRFAHYSKYYPPLLALLCAQGGLMFFDNMLVFAGSIGPVLVGLALVFTGHVRLKSGADMALGDGVGST